MENEGFEFHEVSTRSLLGKNFVLSHTDNLRLPEENEMKDDGPELTEGSDFCCRHGCKFFTCVWFAFSGFDYVCGVFVQMWRRFKSATRNYRGCSVWGFDSRWLSSLV